MCNLSWTPHSSQRRTTLQTSAVLAKRWDMLSTQELLDRTETFQSVATWRVTAIKQWRDYDKDLWHGDEQVSGGL